jgi:predicted nucleic acid-binding Zn ribbon protein
MERAGNILGAAMRQLGQPESALAWLKATWPSLVGEQLAAHTRPKNIRSGVLDLSVDGKDWESQLAELERELRGRINAAWGGSLVREVRLRRYRGAVPREVDNEHVPFIRRGSRARKAGAKA